MTTIKDIAASLELSPATISRALRNDETLSITQETRTRILMAAEKMGYVSKSKKEAAGQKGTTITVIHKQQTFRNQIESSYYFSARSGIEETCAKQHITCTFTTLETLTQYSVDAEGIIIVGNYLKEDFDLIMEKCKGLPMATIGIISYYPATVDHITHSNAVSIQMALDFLFEKGHSKIGYLGIQEARGTEAFVSRKQKFIEIMTARSAFNPEWVWESEHGRDRVERGYSTMKNWIESSAELPTAIFCANDPVALGAAKALHEAQIDIPSRVSLLAHDGTYPTQYSTPPLSTIDVHPFELGNEAVHVLMERITGSRTIAKKVQLHPTLIERESVAQI